MFLVLLCLLSFCLVSAGFVHINLVLNVLSCFHFLSFVSFGFVWLCLLSIGLVLFGCAWFCLLSFVLFILICFHMGLFVFVWCILLLFYLICFCFLYFIVFFFLLLLHDKINTKYRLIYVFITVMQLPNYILTFCAFLMINCLNAMIIMWFN